MMKKVDANKFFILNLWFEIGNVWEEIDLKEKNDQTYQ